MLKVGDKVKIIGKSIGHRTEDIGKIGFICAINTVIDEYELTKVGGIYPISSLELVEAAKETKKETKPAMRTFASGATRDTAEGKLDYTRALCPLVLERYVQYLDKHRKQPDGSYREFDNWKKGLPFRESFSSLGRHYEDLWKMIEGYKAFDNHGECNIDDTLAAIIFNASTMLRERLLKKETK